MTATQLSHYGSLRQPIVHLRFCLFGTAGFLLPLHIPLTPFAFQEPCCNAYSVLNWFTSVQLFTASPTESSDLWFKQCQINSWGKRAFSFAATPFPCVLWHFKHISLMCYTVGLHAFPCVFRKFEVGECSEPKIGGGGTPFPCVLWHFNHWCLCSFI